MIEDGEAVIGKGEPGEGDGEAVEHSEEEAGGEGWRGWGVSGRG